jgi:membrane protein DedA with SNARE-associated domain
VASSESAEAILEWVRDHQSGAAPVVFLLSFLESFAFISLIVPATFVLLGVGAAVGASGIDFLPIYLAAVAGAFFGDWAAFEIAVWLGPKLAATWPISRKPTLLKEGTEWFARWGLAAVFFGRFFGPMRAAIPLVAGALRMSRARFQVANIASAFVWAGAILMPGAVGFSWLLR